jgi:hypothetical protein
MSPRHRSIACKSYGESNFSGRLDKKSQFRGHSRVVQSGSEEPPVVVDRERNGQDVLGPNRGTIQGAVSFISGEVALGWNFDGTSGFVNMPNSSSLSAIKRTVSVEMWTLPRTPAPNSWAYLYSGRDPLLSDSTH